MPVVLPPGAIRIFFTMEDFRFLGAVESFSDQLWELPGRSIPNERMVNPGRRI